MYIHALYIFIYVCMNIHACMQTYCVERCAKKRMQLTVHHTQDSHLALNHAVEIIGKVDGSLNIKVQAATDFGTNIGEFHLKPWFLIITRMGGM